MFVGLRYGVEIALSCHSRTKTQLPKPNAQAAVLDEYPQELGYSDWAADPLKPDEDLLATQIEEAENKIAMLRAEAKVLALRRQQQQANAARAQAQ